MSPNDKWDPSAISYYGDLPGWQSHYWVWLLSHGMLLYWIKWAVYHLQTCALTFIVHVVAPHIQRCVDYYSLITFMWHHTKWGHIYDITTFQTIVMSQIALCDIMMSIVCCWCCQDTFVNILPSLTTTKGSWQRDGRSLHCGDLHRNIP